MDSDYIIEQCAKILDMRAHSEKVAYDECERQMIPDGSVYRHAAVVLLEAAREVRALKFDAVPETF